MVVLLFTRPLILQFYFIINYYFIFIYLFFFFGGGGGMIMPMIMPTIMPYAPGKTLGSTVSNQSSGSSVHIGFKVSGNITNSLALNNQTPAAPNPQPEHARTTSIYLTRSSKLLHPGPSTLDRAVAFRMKKGMKHPKYIEPSKPEGCECQVVL